MDIQVCIGSSCHKRNSYDILKRIKALIEQNNLSETVDVASAFCLGHCKDGATIKIDDQIITCVSMENIDDIFDKYVVKKMGL